MAARRKIPPQQPELPIAGAEAPTPAVEKQADGQMHVQAEQVETPVHPPFSPGRIDLPLHRRVDRSFLEYASYVIRDRALPNLSDGLKPVHRRILWTLHEKDDGRFIKVATVAGAAMQYHPHGDASINDALVVLANKRYLIEGQGNYGNIFTGDVAAAGRYIECRLTELARSEIFNNEITDFVPSYDGRAREPVTLPSKLPLLLMLGTEGIAVGMSARILPHNFGELIEAQIAILKKQPFKVLPDFQTGGLMDAREYRDGAGQIKVRAKIKIKDDSTVLITEIAPTTTTDSLTASIEDASRKGKIKVKSINDFTSEEAEIEVRAPAGISAAQMVDALYAFTDCEVTVASRIVVIRDNRPVELTVSEVLRHNTAQLVATLKRELELKEKQLEQELHFKTLVRLFVENRIYKRIEQARTNEAVIEEIHEGLKPFRRQIRRDPTAEDVEMLLAIRIRRISLFDISKHREEMDKVKADLDQTREHLKNVTRYAIAHLEALLEKYGPLYPRRTKSSRYDEVDAREVAFKSFKVAYDRESGYIGYKVSGEEYKCDCTKFDKLLLVFKDGHYKAVELQEKMFVGPDLVYASVPEREKVITLAYTNRDATYLKRFTFGGTILNKEYFCIPPKSKILFFELDTPAQLFIRYKAAPYQKVSQQTCNPADVEIKGPKTRGRQISIKEVAAIASKPPRGWDPEAATTKLEFV
ncbi:MAG TPA: DNA topoisomerase IV subunit A [Candidatus Baltobacteraceae bacterium]|jgi:topoisomerase-4 subunit A|nr:DNA topoisomerase IV subunit A [Candidatus Baltobacteraceae bacterium]